MYETILFIHSMWAYLVVVVLLIATINALMGFFSKKEYGNNDFRLSLFGLIVTHLQLLIGLVLYFVSPYFDAWSGGMGEVMGNSEIRLVLVEHPFMMLLAVIFITMGYSKHKKKLTSQAKFKNLAIFYTIATLFVLSRIPWGNWF